MDNVRPFQSHDDIRAEARGWVLRFNRDTEPTAEDISALREWAGRSPVHRAELERATEFWCDANLLSELAVPVGRSGAKSMPGSRGRLWARLLPRSFSRAVAAVLFLGIAVVVSLQLSRMPDDVENGTYTTAIGEQKVLILSDASQIQLDTNSQIRVDYGESSRSIHLLRGKAHFDVAKDQRRPFEVYAADGLVRAVGTAFSVYIDNRDVKVTVNEGRVDLVRVQRRAPLHTGGAGIASKREDSSRNQIGSEVFVSLKKGQSAQFNQDEQEVNELSEKDLSRELAWRKGLLIFVGDPLSEVISEVNRYTDINIEILDPELADLQIGGRFRVGELEALFDVLEVGFGVQISYRDKRHVELRSSLY